MTWGYVALAFGTAVGGYMASEGASDAADKQSKAIKKAGTKEERMFNQAQALSAPWRESGTQALAMLNDIYGLQTRVTPPDVVMQQGGGSGAPGSTTAQQLQQFFSPAALVGDNEVGDVMKDFEQSSVGGFFTPHSGSDPLSRLLGGEEDEGPSEKQQFRANNDFTEEEMRAWAIDHNGLNDKGQIKQWVKNTMAYTDFYDWAAEHDGLDKDGAIKDWAKKVIRKGATDYYDWAAENEGVNPDGSMKDWALRSAQEQAQQQQTVDRQTAYDEYIAGQEESGIVDGMRGPDRQRVLDAFQTSPGYSYQLEQANEAAQSGLAAQGMSGSGAELKELQRIAQGGANAEFNNFVSGLQSLAGLGQTSASQSSSQAMAFGGQQAQNALSQGQIAAQNSINQANIAGSMVSQGAQLFGQYQGMQTQQPPSGQVQAGAGDGGGYNPYGLPSSQTWNMAGQEVKYA